METNKWKRDLQFNQIQKQDGSTVVMSFGKSATEQDKNLIAAAPELLDALEMMLAWANIKDGSPSQHIRDIAQGVIQKATKPC